MPAQSSDEVEALDIDERLTVGGQPDFQHKTTDPTLYDAFGNTRERGRRYGIQFNYNFGE